MVNDLTCNGGGFVTGSFCHLSISRLVMEGFCKEERVMRAGQEESGAVGRQSVRSDEFPGSNDHFQDESKGSVDGPTAVQMGGAFKLRESTVKRGRRVSV